MSAAKAIAPPVATVAEPPAMKCRPIFKGGHTRASCISFATASGRERGPWLSPIVSNEQRPTTPRNRPMSSRPHSSHRRLTSDTTTHWQFLTRPATARATDSSAAPPPPSTSRPQSSRPRPHAATAREASFPSTSSSSALSFTTPSAPLPRRPMTCRPSSKATPRVAIDARVLHEAARREAAETQYTGPLHSHSMDVQPASTVLFAPNQSLTDSRVVNAVSRAEIHRTRAFHARASGDFASAIGHYESLIALRPSDITALFQLAVAYEKTGRFHDALATYTRVLPLDDSNAFVHYNVGNLLMQLGRLPQAIEAFTLAIQRSVSQPQAAFFRQRGVAYRQHCDFEKAAQDYARVHAVHKHRVSLARSNGCASGVSTVVADAMQHESRVEGSSKYSAEPIYSPTRFLVVASGGGRGITEPHTALREALAIASKPPSQRDEHELWTLGDVLATSFSLCGALAPDAQLELSRRVIAAQNLVKGTLLIGEQAPVSSKDNATTEPQSEERTADDGFVFFVARGRVDVYKAFHPHVAIATSGHDPQSSSPHTVVHRNSVVAWEELRLAALAEHQDEDADEWEKTSFLAALHTAGRVDVASWTSDGQRPQILLTQLAPGDVVGRQGRFATEPRSYSAVVADASCDLFALRWRDLREVERIHRLATSDQVTRFLSTLPLFHGLPPHDLQQLAVHGAVHCKVVGSRVVCAPGQFVNGLLVVQQGTLCQLRPSQLERPPTLAVSFALSGTVGSRSSGDDPQRSGRQFFTQLECHDDPLLFVHDSAATHGFLSPSFLQDTIAGQAASASTSSSSSSSSSSSPPTATQLTRGGFFCASSSWIPPRQSRETESGTQPASSHGVACAKSALVSTESTELLFFSAQALTRRLSLASRAILHTNMQTLLARRAPEPAPGGAGDGGGAVVPTPLRRLVFLQPSAGDDVVQQVRRDADWQSYKQDLVHSIVQDNRRRPAKSICPWRR